MKKSNITKSAFSLVELIIVTAIISILMPVIFKISVNISRNFSLVRNILKSQAEINTFKENFRIFCWKSKGAEFRKDGSAAEYDHNIDDVNVFYVAPEYYDNLDTECQPDDMSSLEQRDTIFLKKPDDTWGMLRYDPEEQTISYFSNPFDLNTKQVMLRNVLRWNSPDSANTGTMPVFFAALNDVISGSIDCIQVRCQVSIPLLYGNERLVKIRTSSRIKLI